MNSFRIPELHDTMQKIQAVQFHRYGDPDVLACEHIPRPVLKPRHLRVAVHAASVNPVDWRFRRGQLRWIDWSGFPKIPGSDVAGEVLAVGPGIEQFRVGDRVFSMLDTRAGGGYAEEVLVPAEDAALIPENLSMEEAASLPLVSLTAMQALRDKADLKKGGHLLINGASGGVGTIAVQIARAWGARVTGVCSYRNTDLVRSLGAEHAIDYTSADFVSEGTQYDIIFDAFGNLNVENVKQALRPSGRFVTTDIMPGSILRTFSSRLLRGSRAHIVVVRPDGDDLRELASMVSAGAVRPVVDRVYPLCEAAEAHRYSETKRASGKIVLRTDHAVP